MKRKPPSPRVSSNEEMGLRSSAKLRQNGVFHLHACEILRLDKSTSVWENEGGAIVKLFTAYR